MSDKAFDRSELVSLVVRTAVASAITYLGVKWAVDMMDPTRKRRNEDKKKVGLGLQEGVGWDLLSSFPVHLCQRGSGKQGKCESLFLYRYRASDGIQIAVCLVTFVLLPVTSPKDYHNRTGSSPLQWTN